MDTTAVSCDRLGHSKDHIANRIVVRAISAIENSLNEDWVDYNTNSSLCTFDSRAFPLNAFNSLVAIDGFVAVDASYNAASVLEEPCGMDFDYAYSECADSVVEVGVASYQLPFNPHLEILAPQISSME